MSIWVSIADTGSFWSLRSEKQMDIKLFTESFKKKNDPSKNMAFMEDSYFLLWYKIKSLKVFELSPFNTTLTKTEYFH